MEKWFVAKKYRDEPPPQFVRDRFAVEPDDLINLSIGDPDMTTDSRIIDAAMNDARSGYTHYTPSAGDGEIRQEICRLYRDKYECNICENNVMMVVGACHGVFLALQAMLDPGDEVIICEPYFSPYREMVKLAGGVPVFIPSRPELGFEFDNAAFEKAITAKTKAVIINSPNNPTGAVYHDDTLLEMGRIAKSHGVFVISDEVYGTLTYGCRFRPLMGIDTLKDITLTVNSFSKSFAMAGWRLGYLIAPEEMTACIRDINENICYSAPTLAQRGALAGLRLGDDVTGPLHDVFERRLDFVYHRIDSMAGLSLPYPRGSIYAFVNITGTGLSSREFSRRLLFDAHVQVIPGMTFGKTGEGYVRIACTVGMDTLSEAMDRIERFTANL